MALASGTRFGPYKVVELIGSGGMGEVYRATDTKLGREVAIKTLPAALAEDRDRLARFEREAKLLASLNHAHIASVHSLDETDGALYIAMELVEGESLAEKLKSGALPVEEALQIGLQIANALEAAHGKGIVHRDLKPANVMITPDSVVKILDFGLAKAFSGDPNAASPVHSPALSVAMTQQGLILGTAGYMSPEQASGQATDQRTDIWAFGVVLFEMLAGIPLFSGESVPHILADVLRTEPNWGKLPKGLHPRLRFVLERCLAKKVRDRYHSIADVRIEIEKALSDPQGTLLLDADATGPAQSRAARVAASIALVAAGAAIAGIVMWSLRPAPAAPMIDRWSHLIEGVFFRNTWRPVIALSPDGRGFVYNTVEGLFFRAMDELEGRLIPGTEEPLANPFFSPDGRSVAYFNGQPTNGQLMRVSLSGGAPISITREVTNLFGASWESTGMILFGQPEGIYSVPADGGTPDLVISASQDEILYGPELMPDGDSVLFTALGLSETSWDQAQVVIQSLSSNERTVLVQGGSDAHYVATGHLVYALDDGLFAVAFDPATRSVSGGAVSMVQGIQRAADRDDGGTAAANYGISDDGTLVYVAAVELGATAANTPVWVDHTGQEESIGLEGCLCLSPSVSPDGTRLAFQEANADVNRTDIWVWSFTQGTKTRLSFEAGFQIGPVWSPDSQRIAYSTVGEGIFVRSADGIGAPELLLDSLAAVVWDWTIDNELIFTEGGDIGVIHIASREQRPLFTTSFDEYRPAVSPDGRWIAYESNRTGQLEVFVRQYPDVDAGEWLVSSGGGEEPDWGPEGQTLFYLGPGSVMEVTVLGEGPAFTFEPPSPIFDRTRYLAPAVPPRSYAISPGGQRFQMWIPAANAAMSGGAEIIVVRNWAEELKQRVPTD